MSDGRIPEKGPNGGSYPGYTHYNEGEDPPLTPDSRRARNLLALALSVAVLMLVGAVGVLFMESAGSGVADALRANSQPLPGSPTFQPSDTPSVGINADTWRNMQLGFCTVDVTGEGAMKVCAYKVLRAEECAGVRPEKKGAQILIIMVRSTVVNGKGSAHALDWAFSSKSTGPSVPPSHFDCSKLAGVNPWPQEASAEKGQHMDGFLAYEVPPGSGGELFYRPHAEPNASTWKIPSQ